MLVLSRKKDERIVINDNITIVVVEIRGDKVRLGIDAPKEVPVHRQEVHDAIKANERRILEEDVKREIRKGIETLDSRPIEEAIGKETADPNRPDKEEKVPYMYKTQGLSQEALKRLEDDMKGMG